MPPPNASTIMTIIEMNMAADPNFTCSGMISAATSATPPNTAAADKGSPGSPVANANTSMTTPITTNAPAEHR